MPTPDIWTESDLASGRAARQLIKFYWNPTTDEHHIELKQGGQERMVFDSQATEHYQQQYPDEWARYKANVDQSEGQIPLENVQWLDPAMIALLKAKSIHTVNTLAGLSDGVLTQIGPGTRKLRDKAAGMLQAAAKAEQYDANQLKMDATDAELKKLREENAEVRAKNEAMMAKMDKVLEAQGAPTPEVRTAGMKKAGK